MTASISWQSSPFPAPDEATIGRSLVAALSDRADRHPDDIAVIDGPHRYSFAALAARVGGLAERLRAAGAGHHPVATILPMGIDMVAAWFACNAAGRPVLLLDPQNPVARNRAIMAMAGSHILLHARDADASCRDAGPISVIPDGREAHLPAGGSLAPDLPAFIFPTSGSTGEAKLVAHSATTLLARVHASIALMGCGRADRVLIAGGHGNFGFVHHALTFILAGGTLCLFDLAAHGFDALARTMDRERVDHIRFTPSLFRVAARTAILAPALRRLRGLRFSGEPLLWSDIAVARAATVPACRIQNVYGSTESAIFLWTDDRTRPELTGPAPIGTIYPLWDYAVVDDEAGTGVDAPDEGHLIVRSRHQALGDWRDGFVDTARFPIVPDMPGVRRYDTGDVVRRTDGRMIVVDRRDRIIKINGLRVSLAEVEAGLRSLPGCTGAAVVKADAHLVAFIAGPSGPGRAGTARRWLAGHLPRYMIPRRIVTVDAIPLMPGGKIDYQRLRQAYLHDDPEPARQPGDDDAGGDRRWAALEAIWNEVLDRPDAAADSYADFFDLGGDSLQLLTLRLLIERRFEVAVDADQFLTRPTLTNLAAQIGLPSRDVPPLHGVRRDGVPDFRLVRPALATARGIALVMPGRSGAAVVDPWIASDILPDHDLWVCDIGWRAGTLLHRRRWLVAARAIADAIRQGAMPRPAVLIGFSIAGYLAWLVDRLLATTACAPSALVCLDPAPMHRRWQRGCLRVRALVAAHAQGRPAPMLLIRRAHGGRLRAPDVMRPGWRDADGRISEIAVRTFDHADMNTPAVLKTVASDIAAFVAGSRAGSCEPWLGERTVASDSGRLYDLLISDAGVTPEDMEPILPGSLRFGSHAALIAILYLAIAYGTREQVERCTDAITAMAPQSAANRFALRLIARPDLVHTGSGVHAGSMANGASPVTLGTMASIRDAFRIAALHGRHGGHGGKARKRDLLVPRLWMAIEYLRLRLHNQRYRLARMGLQARIAGTDPARRGVRTGVNAPRR